MVRHCLKQTILIVVSPSHQPRCTRLLKQYVALQWIFLLSINNDKCIKRFSVSLNYESWLWVGCFKKHSHHAIRFSRNIAHGRYPKFTDQAVGVAGNLIKKSYNKNAISAISSKLSPRMKFDYPVYLDIKRTLNCMIIEYRSISRDDMS